MEKNRTRNRWPASDDVCLMVSVLSAMRTMHDYEARLETTHYDIALRKVADFHSRGSGSIFPTEPFFWVWGILLRN